MLRRIFFSTFVAIYSISAANASAFRCIDLSSAQSLSETGFYIALDRDGVNNIIRYGEEYPLFETKGDCSEKECYYKSEMGNIIIKSNKVFSSEFGEKAPKKIELFFLGRDKAIMRYVLINDHDKNEFNLSIKKTIDIKRNSSAYKCLMGQRE